MFTLLRLCKSWQCRVWDGRYLPHVLLVSKEKGKLLNAIRNRFIVVGIATSYGLDVAGFESR